jgi:hypothetical protein
MRDRLRPTSFPTLVASLRDLEQLMSLPPGDIEKTLTTIVSDPEWSTWTLGNALDTTADRRNPLLNAAWNSYPWLVEREAEKAKRSN